MKATCVKLSPSTSYAADSATGVSPSAERTRPVTTITATLAMKRYVGSAKALLDSDTPRRFIAARTTTKNTASSTRSGLRPGNAEIMLSTPLATETVTVRM